MLFRIDESGRFYEIKDVGNRKNYEQWLSRFEPIDLEAVRDFLKLKISDYDKFAVAWLLPKVWDYPLIKVFEVGGNEESAALLLGKITQEILIRDEKEWLCTKTDLNSKRDIEINFYWTKES